MSTFFLDLEAGNDASDGTTFANRWKTMTLGATAARIAPGDTIRLMKSLDPTSVGTCQWVNTIADAFLDAPKNISAVSNATPIQITTSTTHGLSTGDVVQITGQTGNRYINGLWVITVVDTTKFTLDGSLAAGAGGTATGTIRKYNSRALKLSTQCNKTIDQCEVAWTASANVTATLSTTNKQGDSSSSLAIASAFTTGLAAYRALPATIDFSAYQQVTIWIQVNAALAASTLSIRLCSDAAGVTTVDTLAIPAIVGLNRWIPITIDKGSALGASIASIALYADLDPGTITVLLDCIVAVKSVASADSLGLQSLIGKNTSDETFYPIASIEEKLVALDCGPQWDCAGLTHMGYWGSEESVTTYKLEPIKLTDVNSGAMGLVCNDNGTAGNPITYSGGWNRTDMTTQTGMSWVDGRNGLGTGFTFTGTSFNTLSKIGAVRFSTGFGDSGTTNLILDSIHANGNLNNGIINGGDANTTFSTEIYCCNNYQTAITLGRSNNVFRLATISNSLKKLNCNGGQRSSSSNSALTIVGVWTDIGTISQICGNWTGNGVVQLIGANQISIDKISNLSANTAGICANGIEACVINEITSAVSNASLFVFIPGACQLRVKKLIASGHTQTAIVQGANGGPVGGTVYVRQATISDTALFSGSGVGDPIFSIGSYGGTAQDCRINTIGGNIITDTTFRHTASGVSWRFAPTSTTSRTSASPLRQVIASLACVANTLVTVSAWFRRTSTALTGTLVCKKLQLTGIAADVSSSMTASGDQTPTSITRSGSTATVTKTAHGYSTGNIVQITGAAQTEYNVVATITVTDADHFTYAVAGTPATPATGTLVMGQWEKLTITFTPTEAGVVEIEAQCYGGSTNFMYVDDVEKSQA